MSEQEMIRELAAYGWTRRADKVLGGWYWISPEGRAKPTTEIAYGYLQTLKSKGTP